MQFSLLADARAAQYMQKLNLTDHDHAHCTHVSGDVLLRRNQVTAIEMLHALEGLTHPAS